MTKATVDTLIQNMKKAGVVTKATPWMVEGFGEKEMNVRFVGVQLDSQWEEILSSKNKLLLKFITDRSTARLEFYLANKPPFIKIITKQFSQTDKWESLLGDLRRRLRHDKIDFQSHTEQIGNLYAILKPHLIA